MTSSLVGSEMCIRDSPKRGRAAPTIPLGSPARVPRYGAAPSRQRAQPRCCLLYTSDAADECSV
eukprot:9539211-Prorocentrum_lima.AAC.1